MKLRLLLCVCLLLIVLSLGAPALAETNATYDLSWWTADGGGVSSVTTGSYTLSGTAGQPDAGVASSGDYDLTGGFWAALLERIKSFLPLIKK